MKLHMCYEVFKFTSNEFRMYLKTKGIVVIYRKFSTSFDILENILKFKVLKFYCAYK